MGVGIRTAHFRAAALIASAATLLCAPSALADTASSSNWAGYAAHRSGTAFRTVQGTWRQPSATCTPGQRTYSSYWVGLGGFSSSSPALEQIGTEVDCTAGGQVRSTAWYELVPAPSVPIALAAQPGDLMTASVTANGNKFTLTLNDVTRKHAFTKTVSVSPIDVSSAEWIVEAPSDCVNSNLCQTLPLANFGNAQFESALATSTRGHTGAIADFNWDATKIVLMPQGNRFFITNGSPTSVGSATPSGLSTGGHSFKVAYSQLPVATGSTSYSKPSAVLRAGYLLHPRR